MRSSRKYLILACMVFLVGSSSHAQDYHGIPSYGCDFFLGYLTPITHTPYFSGVTESTSLLVSSYSASNVVTISYFDSLGHEGQSITKVIQTGRTAQISFDRQHLRPTRLGEVAEWKAMHITSRDPISIQYYSQGSCTGELLQAIPTAGLGKHYVIASFNDNGIAFNPGFINRDSSSGQFMIVAPYDNTTVTYTPTSTTYSGVVGVNYGRTANGSSHPRTITLNRGQIFLVQSEALDTADISGSHVIADKPIAIIAGHERALLGDPSHVWNSLDNDIRNMLLEEMTPVESWGSEYVSIPNVPAANVARLLVNGRGNLYRVFTADTLGDDAVNFFLDASPSTALLTQYQHPVTSLANVTVPVRITAAHGRKIYAVMYDYFQGQHDSDPGSLVGKGKGITPQDETSYRLPTESNLVPETHWQRATAFKIPAQSDYRNAQWINLITYGSGADSITLSMNGLPDMKLLSLPHDSMTIPGRSSGADRLVGFRFRLASGDYFLHSSSTPFVAYSYGRTEGQYKDG